MRGKIILYFGTPERLRTLRGYPLRLTTFASSPKGTPYGNATTEAVPLRADFPRPGEDVA